MGNPAETNENLWNADIDESQIEDSPTAFKRATPHGESGFHKREKSMAERQAHVTTDKKSALKLDWENKEKQFKESFHNASVSAIEKDTETNSKHCSFENQSGIINDLGISHDKLRVKHPLKASVFTNDKTDTDLSHRQEVNLDLR